MTIYLGSDHAGFEVKERVQSVLEERGISYVDMGVNSNTKKVDFPDYAFMVGEKVAAEEAAGKAALGILACGSAGGMVVAANKVKGIRAVTAMNEHMAASGRIHDNANVLVLAGRFTAVEYIPYLVEAFLDAEYDAVERRIRRMQKIADYENQK